MRRRQIIQAQQRGEHTYPGPPAVREPPPPQTRDEASGDPFRDWAPDPTICPYCDYSGRGLSRHIRRCKAKPKAAAT